MYSDDITGNLLGRLFMGTVEAIINPGTVTNGYTHNTYKAQVRIPPLHGTLPVSSLPYCSIMNQVFRGAKANQGVFNIPTVGSEVVVLFDGGDNKAPIIIGALYASNTQISAFTDPAEWGWEDNFGNQFIVDASGNITLNAQQNVTINSQQNINEVAQQNITINGKQQVLIETNSCSITIDNNKVAIVGNTEIDLIAPTINLNGNVNIGPTGKIFNINGNPWTEHIHQAGSVPVPPLFTVDGTVTDSNIVICTGDTGTALTPP